MSNYILSGFATNIVFEDSITFLNMISDDIFIIDKNIFDIYYDYFKDIKSVYLFDATENNKSLGEVEKLYDFFNKKSVHRSTNIVAIGGGVTTDTVAFAVSTYKRGCRLTLIPTTLLSMCDASIGGKTAVNFAKQKNIIGSFYPAENIYIYPKFLKSLSKLELTNGKAEMVKSFLISQNSAHLLKNNIDFTSSQMIMEAIKVKMNLCMQDTFDKAVRRFLNLGHTFAHIIESLSNYEIPHGQAVLVGIYAASLLSYKMRFLTHDDWAMIRNILSEFEFPKLPDFEKIDKKIVFSDKKNNTKINLVLLNKIGMPFIYQTDKWHLVKDILVEVAGLFDATS